MNGHRDVLVAAERSLREVLEREPTAQEITELLVENQIPLLSLCQPEIRRHESNAKSTCVGQTGSELVDSVVESSEFAKALEANRALYREAQGHFARFASTCSSRGAPCICFKSAGIPPSYPYTSDNYDILFREEDEDIARQVLMELGYVELTNTEEPQKWLFRLFIGGRSVSAIHLHTRVGWGQGFMLEDEIWARRRQSEDDPVTWVPGTEDVILINVAHAFFENKAFGLHDLMKVRQAIRDGVDWEYADRVALERGWLRSLHFGLAMLSRLETRLFDEPVIPKTEAARFEQTALSDARMAVELDQAASDTLVIPFPTSWRLVKILFFEKIRLDGRVSMMSKASLAFLTLARGLKSQANARPQNSGLVTLSGVDGSGKTTQAEALLEVFNACHLRTQVTWARVGATPIMFRLSRLWRRNRGDTRASSTQAREQWMTQRQGLPLVVWAVMSSADFALWLLGIRWRLLRGDVVIADRYQPDYEVEMRLKLRQQVWVTRLLVKFLGLIAPKPTAAFLLHLNPDQALERAAPDSGDFTAEDQIELYGHMADKYGLIPVCADRPFEEVSSHIAREALRAYMRRYGMLGNVVFFSNPWQLNRPTRQNNTPSPVEAA